jgi:hypothetical protein
MTCPGCGTGWNLKEKDETDLMAKPIFNEDTLSEFHCLSGFF